MKKLLSTMFLIVLALLTSLTAFATENADSIKQRTTIKVGYLENYGIINTPSIRGGEGFGYEYLKEIEKRTNYHFEFISTSWVKGFEMLERGELDLFGVAAMNEERKQRVEFVETPICYESACIYAPIGSDLYYNDPAGLDGLTIGLTQGAVYRDALEAYIAKNNLNLKIKFTEHTNFMQYIKDGEIDVFLTGSLFNVDGTKVIDKLYSEPLYFISTKGNKTICNNIKVAIDDIESDNPYFNELLWYKYYGDNHKASKSITRQQRSVLAEKESYTVGYHADLRPMSYTNENGEPKGYSIDVMNILADRLSIKVNYVPLHGKENNLPQDVDFNLCPLDDSCATHYNVSEPYNVQNLVVSRNMGIKKSEVKNILVFDFSTIHIEDFLELYPSAKVHKAYSSKESKKIYNSVDIDCLIFPEGSEMLVPNDTNKNISVLDASLPICITVSDALPLEVLTALNSMITALSKGDVDELVMENVMLLQPKHTFWDTFIKYQNFIITIILLIISAFTYVLWRSRKKIKQLLEIDTLTKLLSKYKFTQLTESILANKNPNDYLLILFDIDNFKNINKIYGIEIGNKLLLAVANSLKKRSKSTALISRIQNDVFAVLTENTSLPEISIDDELETAITALGIEIPVYYSVGVYTIKDPKENIAYMLDRARIAKQKGKTTFGNTIHFFTKELQKKSEKETEILFHMEYALKNNEFFILIQPKVELQTLKLTGGEVLVRWRKADGTFIYPDEFIPLFERNQFIKELDEYIFEQTCRFIKNADIKLPILSVNLSAVSLLTPNTVERYVSIAESYGIKPNQLEIELTESAIETDFAKIKSLIHDFKTLGFNIAIDDFGKGESSLTRIKELEIDTIKLDKGFIDNKIETEKDVVVLKNLITMINSLGYSTIMEGIETENHRKLILNMGCEYGQGYLFDRPLPTDEFMKRVRNSVKEETPKIMKSFKKTKRYLRDIDSLPYCVVVAANNSVVSVTDANERFYKLIGYTKKEFLLMHSNSLKSILTESTQEILTQNLSLLASTCTMDLHLYNAKSEEIMRHTYINYNEQHDVFIFTLIN